MGDFTGHPFRGNQYSHGALVSHLTQLDQAEQRNENARGLRTNIHRIGHYLEAANGVKAAVEMGTHPAQAFADHFTPTRGMHSIAKKLDLGLDVSYGTWTQQKPAIGGVGRAKWRSDAELLDRKAGQPSTWSKMGSKVSENPKDYFHHLTSAQSLADQTGKTVHLFQGPAGQIHQRFTAGPHPEGFAHAGSVSPTPKLKGYVAGDAPPMRKQVSDWRAKRGAHFVSKANGGNR